MGFKPFTVHIALFLPPDQQLLVRKCPSYLLKWTLFGHSDSKLLDVDDLRSHSCFEYHDFMTMIWAVLCLLFSANHDVVSHYFSKKSSKKYGLLAALQSAKDYVLPQLTKKSFWIFKPCVLARLASLTIPTPPSNQADTRLQPPPPGLPLAHKLTVIDWP